ncbi:MAG: orotidine-5'-phosphate decarboxylase [Treponema sp.]|jgi:orotidine-5'-phosphate decarboxylase|nr:orotidine-5'-phosphate decarboxylase [Treponema sp.]
MHNMDKLFEAVARRGPVCVGLDTETAQIPPGELRRAESEAHAILAFNRALIDAVADTAACFKVQIAFYEALGLAGLDAYAKTLRLIRGRGGLVIADIKRGDIAGTAAHYARAHFSGDFEADFVTLSPYMGMDTLEPWLARAEQNGKGAFVLMRTSNPGMADFQNLIIEEGGDPRGNPETAGSSSGDPPPAPRLSRRQAGQDASAPPPPGGSAPKPPRRRRLWETVGDRLAHLASMDAYAGSSGYGAFGAVAGAPAAVSAAGREEAAAIRRAYPGLFFLIPGYGAQGGGPEDAAMLLREGNGGVVNASRSILNAWKTKAAALGMPPEEARDGFAAEAAREAAAGMAAALRAAAGRAVDDRAVDDRASVQP